MLKYFLATICMSACICSAAAHDISGLKHKKKLLKGQWQLIKTVNNGTPHDIGKEEYDDIITFKSCHRYQQEVNYESYHWIIKGKWKVYRKTAALELTKLEYILGTPPGADLQDIHFSLYQMDKTHWSAATETKAEKIKMEYQRIPKKGSSRTTL